MPILIALVLAFAMAIASDKAAARSPQPQQSVASAQSLRSDIAAELNAQGLVGATWSALRTDGSVTTGAAGLKNAQYATPLEPDDKVQVGSIAKSLLAVGILRLASEGRLNLDDPVTALLPDVRFDNPWAATSPVLVRHLLDHTSGLDDVRLRQVFSLKASPSAPLRNVFSGDPSLLRIYTRPGSTTSYSNMGYTLAGRVIEAVTGNRYETYLDRYLLAPLGMKDSSFRFITQVGANGDPRLAMGHFEGGVPHAAVPQQVRPAGQFTTTARDMALFARFLLGNGDAGGKPFVDARLLRAMGRPTDTDAALAGLEAGYALGLARRDRNGVVGLCHGGSTVGYRAMFCIYPEERKAYFIALNADVEGADYARFDALITRALGIAGPLRLAAAAMPREMSDWSGVYVPSPSRFQTFAYFDEVLGFLLLSQDGDRLRLLRLQSPALELEPVGGRLFRANGRVAPSHVMLSNPAGERLISDGFQSYRRTGWLRIGLLWISLAAGVVGLAYILLAGLARAASQNFRLAHPLLLPWFAVLALLAPTPLFLSQPFLQLGDLTAASGTLAIASAILPLALLLGVVQHLRVGVVGWFARLELAAVTGALQWCVVLAAWELLPLKLWA